ncbi:hypothetical protein FM076_14990 [Streptomyces albus subsp. chlorinus]|uniref:hypothetical protein n=1 Tax=Streptomyces albus TaxID=1888 RepID=UPI00156DEB23|nr:hypothetical protein [Streptomyces albus]NSC22415.1 hypothetical protein [Streptomyces albus subsp. chlorinus]
MAPTLRLRTAVAGLVAAGLVGAGAATATAAPADTSAASTTAAKTNTVTADRTDVKQWEQFRLRGKVTGIKAGTTVRLQQKQRDTWKTLPGTSSVNRSLDYSIRVKLGIKGGNEIRTLVGEQPSNVVKVTVR